MKIYTIVGFQGHFPVGTAAVVVAADADEAARMLNTQLETLLLPGAVTAGDMEELQIAPGVKILCDGNY